MLLVATASIAASQAATYSASAVDRATMNWRRDIHDTAPPANVKTNPVVLFRDAGSLAQSLSQ
ncbi:hypothetical protein PF011_g32858 [Phytophthora fragariae]|uniref:Uncharacterized protein n=1 Tax=Phytophthora fragariae TaxID=53985 RepID=A0A6A3GD42_9STRA|nr:hypothetical protein PF003_g20227 [Phytophthora fragariae]KAE8951868.1 hypothetical protein PF011_g32858 [Phytophthora fragariae]KAE9310546.1 hypothetical protein PF008_g20433 [Phytophthora fragariae]